MEALGLQIIMLEYILAVVAPLPFCRPTGARQQPTADVCDARLPSPPDRNSMRGSRRIQGAGKARSTWLLASRTCVSTGRDCT
jgi:hypothetical protein